MTPEEHITDAEFLLDELTEQWRVGDPESRIKLAQTHAQIAIARLLLAKQDPR